MRKILALIMAVAMIATFASLVYAKDDVTVTYTFDAEGADAGLTAHGDNITYNEDGTVTLGAESWFESDLDFVGASSITVTAKIKGLEAASGAVWIYEISSETAHNWPSEHYFAAFFDNSADTVTVQAFNDDDGSRTEQPQVTVTSDITEVKVEYSTNVLSTYVNGEKVADTTIAEHCDISQTITTAGSDEVRREAPVLQIGKANWGTGEYANGLTIDELTVTVSYAEAPQTGFATIALAVVALGSGAYVVSKKH